MERHFYKTTIYTPNGPRTSGFWRPPEEKQVTKVATALTGTTGLVTRKDFVNEAKRLGVGNAAMFEKFAAYFTRKENGEIGEGMCRMQCNMLIKNAVKKKGS